MSDRKNNHSNIYSELFESVPIPERLLPENIAKMLDANSAAASKRAEITLSAKSSEADTVSAKGSSEVSGRKRSSGKITVAYRVVASLAACAVLALGVVRYLDTGSAIVTDSEAKGSAYADGYDQLHQTFIKYYVDDEYKKTLDSAMAEIAHSYNNAESDTQGDKVDPPKSDPSDKVGDNSTDSAGESPAGETPSGETPATDKSDVSAPDVTEPVDDNTVKPADREITVDLPEYDEGSEPDNVVIGGDKIYIRDGSTIKIIRSAGGQMEYLGDAVPQCGIFETKKLEAMFALGDRLAAVYTVINEEPISVPAFEDGSVVGGIVNDIYPDDVATVKTGSVELVVYDILPSGEIIVATSVSQPGKFTGVRENGGNVYFVTEYSDYRHSPLAGVYDLEGYVPSYTLNGEKMFILSEDILIPDYIATTNYTVITGVACATPDISVSVQAILGTEEKAVLTDKYVYIFRYSEQAGVPKTICESFGLEWGRARFIGTTAVEGVAISDGIYENGGNVFVVTLKGTDSGIVTSVTAISGSAILSKVDLPAIASKVNFDGAKVNVFGSSDYTIDFSTAAVPVVADCEIAKDDIPEGLVPFGDGYVTLTVNESGELRLEKIKENANGGFVLETGKTVCESGAISKAINNNFVMYTDAINGYVGVPYGFFDGFDYCYRFELFKLGDEGFAPVGMIQSHEVEDAFEIGRSKLSGGILYVFSEGRVYAVRVGQDALSVVSSAELIQSSYSGHTTSW